MYVLRRTIFVATALAAITSIFLLFRMHRGHPVRHLYLLIAFMGIVVSAEALSTALRQRLATNRRVEFLWDILSAAIYAIGGYLFFEYIMPPV